ncbi:hypothetical protein G7Y79_00004g012580 [Physcia stellaris]|nr:hypothetical protein G7Y79_00004g012580 [Physcia stellaris]
MAKAKVKSQAAAERKARCRKNHRRKVRAIKPMESVVSGRRALLEHRQKNNAGRRWLSAQLDQLDHGISEASRKRLRGFWRRPQAKDECATTFSAAGEAEEVPDMDQETLAHYRRFEAAWAVREGAKKGWNKVEGATEGEDGE